MNPDFLAMVEDSLAEGFAVLVLTNAMKPMQQKAEAFLKLHRRFPGQLSVRVSIDHYEAAQHEAVRGPRTWQPAIDGLKWLSQHGFKLSLAGRKLWTQTEQELRDGYAQALAGHGIHLETHDAARLVLFPEMDATAEVPEISQGCWNILKLRPDSMMCASSRMVVKRKGADGPTVISCTLLPYADGFEMGATLVEAARPVPLNHRHCAKFCVLGGASCSVSR